MNGDSSTVLRYKFHRRGVMNVPCPKCGGKLVLGMVFREDEIRCTQCEEKWSSENAPGNFSENTYFWNVTIDGDSQPEEPAPLHPVDAAIITDWLLPDDEDMTWDDADGRYPAEDDYNEPDDETDITWDEYRAVMTDAPKNFSEADQEWLLGVSPTPVLAALDMDLMIADEECMKAAADKLIELGQFWGDPKTMVKTLYDTGYWWDESYPGYAWVGS